MRAIRPLENAFSAAIEDAMSNEIRSAEPARAYAGDHAAKTPVPTMEASPIRVAPGIASVRIIELK